MRAIGSGEEDFIRFDDLEPNKLSPVLLLSVGDFLTWIVRFLGGEAFFAGDW